MIAAKKLMMASGFVPDPDARALIARMSPKPSVGRQRAINELIVAMKNGGSWARMKNFYVLAAHAQQPALLNWKGDTDTLSVAGSLSFVPDTGVPGSTTNRLSYNMDLRSTTEFGAGGFISYTGSHPQDGQPVLFGFNGNSSNRSLIFGPYFSAGRYVGSQQVLNNRSGTAPEDVAARKDYFLHASSRSGGFFASENGRFLGDDQPGSSPNTGPFSVFGVNYYLEGGGVGGAYSSALFRASWSGLSLTIVQTNALRAALTTYLQKVGAIA